MRRAFWTALIAAALSVGAAARQTASQPPAADKKAPGSSKTLTLTGCVEKGTTPSQYTLLDEDNGKYEVSGSEISKYLGRRVQVAGVPGSTRLKVKGGLWPTPNAAGQAGDLDPARAAIAAQPGGGATGTGEVNLPTLKVRSVRTVDGGCK